MSDIIRVMVVAASPVIRMGLSAMLDDNPKLTVTSASLFDSLTEDEMQLPPDVLLLDWNDRESKTLIQQSSAATIILISELEDINLGTVLAARIKGVLPQTVEESEIIAAIFAVAAGLVVLHPGVIDNLSSIKANSHQQTDINLIQTLTPREIEVLQMLTNGLSNKVIAQQMHISEHTVKFHISSIFQKLDVSTRTEAVTVGIRLGLIML